MNHNNHNNNKNGKYKVMFEDSFKNLVTAKSLGMSTVFVQSDTAREEGVGSAELDTVDAVVCDVSFFFLHVSPK